MTIQASSMSVGAAAREPLGHYREPAAATDVALDLTGAILSVRNSQPMVLVLESQDRPAALGDALPSGCFLPGAHASLEAGMRGCVEAQTGLELGYIEQLCTFGDQDPADEAERRRVSIGYLALVLGGEAPLRGRGTWRSIYDYFPWEDWRNSRPAILVDEIEPHLRRWALACLAAGDAAAQAERERLTIAFGLDSARWDDERVLERYELMANAGLLHEARNRNGARPSLAPASTFGRPMARDHRRILAAAVGRLRAKIRYRPVVFELMASEFTLFDLQRTVEAILGPHLHKQNFRRLVESIGLVEPTGDIRTHTGGRPAKLYRFRRDVLLERPAPGVRINAAARG
jgi:hypothetical protein